MGPLNVNLSSRVCLLENRLGLLPAEAYNFPTWILNPWTHRMCVYVYPGDQIICVFNREQRWGIAIVPLQSENKRNGVNDTLEMLRD